MLKDAEFKRKRNVKKRTKLQQDEMDAKIARSKRDGTYKSGGNIIDGVLTEMTNVIIHSQKEQRRRERVVRRNVRFVD